MRNYVQYSENLNGFPTFFIFLSLMLIFGSMALRKLECMRGVERRKLKTKLNWRALEAGSKSLHAVFLQFGQLYLSRAVECISRGLNILRGGTQLNWRGRDISTNENFVPVTDHQLLLWIIRSCSICQNWSTVFLWDNWDYFSPSRFNTCKEESQTEIELDNMGGFAISANEKFVQVTDHQPATALRKC